MARKPLTEEQKAALGERLKLAREAKRARGSSENEPVVRDEPEIVEPDEEPAAVTEPSGFTSDELAEIEARVREKIDEELAERARAERKAMLGKAYEEEYQRQRRIAGLTSARDDMVEFLVNVAPFSPGLVVDGHVYPHGTWTTQPRHVYDSMRDTMANSHRADDRAGARSTNAMQNQLFAQWREHAPAINPMAMEQRMPDGTFTVSSVPSISGRTSHSLNYPSA